MSVSELKAKHAASAVGNARDLSLDAPSDGS